MISSSFFIVGSEDCERCEILQKALPGVEMVKIPNRTLGVGDTISRITYFFNIPSCRSCKIRRSFLNRVFPYFWRVSKDVRNIRNTVLKLGYEELPVLLDNTRSYVHDIDRYVPGFTSEHMITH